MAFNATSFFSGVATVVATVAIGFGGGVLLTDALVGASEKPSSVIARRAAEAQRAAVPAVAPAVDASVTVARVPEQASGADISSVATRPSESFAKASDADLRRAASAERKAQRRKSAERRKREIRRLEQQAADRSRASERDPGRALFAEPPHLRIFGSD